jgi:hypothetical protein
MKRSTILTLLIGLAAGVLLTAALGASGGGRFSLRLCPVPAVTDQASHGGGSGEAPWIVPR